MLTVDKKCLRIGLKKKCRGKDIKHCGFCVKFCYVFTRFIAVNKILYDGFIIQVDNIQVR